ncbi:hypothetical protein K503DRAFT_777616 [Rhizopogon vinicolor AM-OR11-026]|uniref:Uncharacterized protein n=1 Tax=Rhizopogon vinicolor AM-OR11-026 TaxID=1314800 RepID=A0A1B7MFP5_9AGAM|nr:hypothetical protein K503DRAFT_777616 [Rhizopogon vinicolor AM-OR11-026]
MVRPKRVHSIWATNLKSKKEKTVGDGSNKENVSLDTQVKFDIGIDKPSPAVSAHHST